VWKDSEWATQQGSYSNAVVPPTSGPCDPPTVSVCINVQWIPYVCGALSQLCQPSTWDVASEDDLIDVLERVTGLISAIGTAMPCVSPAPVLGTASTAQQACNIAGYLANILIKDSIQKAIDAINQNQTVLGYGVIITGAIPGAGVIIPTIAKALYELYGSIEGGTLTDYQDALEDPTLWSKITCAIFTATQGDGQVMDTNFAAVQAAVAAVSYTHAEVITTISAYLANLGSAGVQQLQAAGAFADYDCSSCGSGVSTGPAGLPTRQIAGSASATILAGSAQISTSVAFVPAFAANPIITLQCADPVLIASASSISGAGFTLTITAAVNVDSDTPATVDYLATLPGSAP